VTSARENSHGNGADLPRVPSIPLSDDVSAAADQSIGGLVRDATTHISTLIRGEFELARTELGKEVKKGLTGSVFFIVALVLFLLFIPFGLVALSLGFNDMFDWENHPWLGFLVLFGAAFIGAAALAFLGWRRFKKIRAPRRTIDTAKDTVAALRRGDDEPSEPAQLERRP
jgi:uncharacterized membrane protein YqjE